GVAPTSDRAVEAAAAELRFAFRVEIAVAPVCLEGADHLAAQTETPLQLRLPDEAEVVGRRVVLGELAVGRPGQAADGEIEPRRAELALVVAVGREVDDAVRTPRAPQDVVHDEVDLRLPLSA